MPRDYRVSLKDIKCCLDRIRILTLGLDFEEFTENLTKQRPFSGI